MAISITGINPPAGSSVSSIVSNAAAPFVNGAQSAIDRQPSAVVTLSAQGQQLSRSQSASNQTQVSQSQTSNTTNTAAAENVESQSKETSEAPGIQFMEGESKGGRVNTYA